MMSLTTIDFCLQQYNDEPQTIVLCLKQESDEPYNNRFVSATVE
jgi:hypothetical protein